MAEFTNNDWSNFDWDSDETLATESKPSINPGTYDFTVVSLERSFYRGSSEKIASGCPCIKLTLAVEYTDKKDENGNPYTCKAFKDLFFQSNMRWQVINFLRCIGVIEPTCNAFTPSMFKDPAEFEGKRGKAEFVKSKNGYLDANMFIYGKEKKAEVDAW